ncbi:hypothetical protein AA313_de0202523 [Arthrobotrys entomopaga]|nr:hypothetical protein AA313_de0202523 [Arthrobotrys entomopaga]
MSVEVPRPVSSPAAVAMSSTAAPNVNSHALKLGKQPMPKELDWELYKSQVLDKFISEVQLGDSEDDLTSGPYSQNKAKFNDVLQELLAIQFTITKLEARPNTSSTSSSTNILGSLSFSEASVASAAAAGSSKRNTQDTMLTVPPETLETSLVAKIRQAETSSLNSHGEHVEEVIEEAEKPEEEVAEVQVAQEEETQEPERPASRASIASSSSDESNFDPDRPYIEGPIHDWFPAVPRYLTRRQKIKRAIWSVKLAPGKATASVKKTVFGEEKWSDSPYFLYDEYRESAGTKGLIEKLKFEFQLPDPSSPAGKIYARACEPYFRQPGTTKRECVSCTDMFPVTEIITLDCDHKYCEPCLNMMVLTAAQQESTMPPKCCGARVLPNVIRRVLKTDEEKIKFSRKIIEYDTSVEKRLFCPKKKCGAFIPYHPRKDQAHPLVGTCQKCGTRACRICKGKAHKPNQDCPEDLGLNAVIDLSKETGWKRCYRCRAMIELNYGCNHMTCRCGAEFCYICGNPWSFEYGCPTGCTQVDDDVVHELVHEIAANEAAAAAAIEAEVVAEGLSQEDLEAILASERLQRTQEDLKIKALLRTQKAEQEMFNKYSGGVIFKLRQRHYEELTDLKLEHVGEFLTHNSELEDRTIELSQAAREKEAEFCLKLGMTVQEVKNSAHEEEYSALCFKHREDMVKMKKAWDAEHTALQFRHKVSAEKLGSKQYMEEQVVEMELSERKTNFVTQQRNVLARMIEWRRIATGEDYSPAETVYTTVMYTDEEAKLLEDELLAIQFP